MNDNPKKKKTFMGRLLKGIAKVGKLVSPQLSGLINAVTGENDFQRSKWRRIS